MIRKGFLVIGICTLFVLGFTFQAMAVDESALAAESAAYCKSTAKERFTTPDMIITKVNEACKLLKAEGEAAFPKFKGKESNFLYEGTYVWVHTLKEAKMIMHPIKHKMEGKDYMGLKDKNGKRLFVAMNALVKEKGEGWVEYIWPKPGTNDFVRKISFVKYVKFPSGLEAVAGSGIYNGDPTELAKLEMH